MPNISQTRKCHVEAEGKDAGFSLVEVVIALVILTIVVLGVFATFAYATRLNTGNSSRSQALSVLQKEVELLRSAKFLPQTAGGADAYTPVDCNDPRRNLTGTPDGAPRTMACNAIDGMTYYVQTEIDDDPYTPGQQVDTTKNLKQISLTVTFPTRPGSWEGAYVTRAVFRRVRSN